MEVVKFGEQAGRKNRNYDIKEEKDVVGQGNFSIVRRASVSPEGAPDYKHTLILKRPRVSHSQEKPETEEEIKMLLRGIAVYMQTYQALKKAGLKNIPTTYQVVGIEEKEPAIAMTDFTEDGKNVVLSNNTAFTKYEFDDVLNRKELFNAMIEDVKKMTAAGYYAALDSYFFIAPKDQRFVKSMHFALADFDQCYDSPYLDDKRTLFGRNVEEASFALERILHNHLADNQKKVHYRNELLQWRDQVIREYNPDTQSQQ
jgi:hypothetical protein